MDNTKKSSNASMDNKRFLFVLMGLVLALAVVFVSLEWGQKDKTVNIETGNVVADYEEELIDQTVQEEEQPIEEIKPEVPQVIEQIEIVEDNVKTHEVEYNSDLTPQPTDFRAPVAPPAEDEDDKVIFKVVEKMPEFPGGAEKLNKYLSEQIRYPYIAIENGIQGRVICQFTVFKDGSIGDIEVVKSGPHESLNKEAVRVIGTMPKWTPGQQRNKAVNCKFTLPVVFRLS
jgi:protein TonB